VCRSLSLSGRPCNSIQVRVGVSPRHSFNALHIRYVISFDLTLGVFLLSIIAFFSVKHKHKLKVALSFAINRFHNKNILSN